MLCDIFLFKSEMLNEPYTDGWKHDKVNKKSK
jgi:hypothetical protein